MTASKKTPWQGRWREHRWTRNNPPNPPALDKHLQESKRPHKRVLAHGKFPAHQHP